MKMKRVGICGFKQFEVGRKMALCLRLGGVDNTNGDVIDKCRDHNFDPEHRCSGEDFKKGKCDCFRTKVSIFHSIRKKWRRHRRGKRGENRKRNDPVLNMCHPQDEIQCSCLKHQKLKCQNSSKSTVSSLPSCAYICNTASPSIESRDTNDCSHNDQNTGCSVDTEDCSCFGSPNRKAFSNVTAKVAKIKARASRSMSDISSVATATLFTSMVKTDSVSNICRTSSLMNSSTSRNGICYANGVCVDSQDDSIAQEENQPLQKFGNLTQELYKLSKYGWYWGPISRSEAESKLVDQPDGAFLVRDSSDDRYILSLSFRSYGKTLHTRIEHSSGLFSFYSQPEPEGHASIVELIEQSMCYSQSGVFCYSRSRSPGSPSFPVRLTKPISRFTQVRSLQYLCRFVIRQYTRFDHIQKLPLPQRIKGYLEEGHY